mmetsp:Transcript_15545/g.31825  ORF Transcript_15545/g.31825 Transcript_15545/m.31825 type:complete len:268 (-) Transcript_15545:98-901(-)
MMVVISDTVMRDTSSPSIAMILSPGLMLSARTDEVLTPDTTVPLASVLFARMIPSFPGGATTVTFDLLAIEEEEDVVLLPPLDVLLELEFRPMLPTDRSPAPPPPAPNPAAPPASTLSTATAAAPPPPTPRSLPTMASCISSRSRSFATERLCSDICDRVDLADRCEYLDARELRLPTESPEDRCRPEDLSRRDRWDRWDLCERWDLWDLFPVDDLDRVERPLRDSRSAAMPRGPRAPVTSSKSQELVSPLSDPSSSSSSSSSESRE